MFLYHYYDASIGPFRNSSDLSMENASKILRDTAAGKPDTMCTDNPEKASPNPVPENDLLSRFVDNSIQILGSNLCGIYLHGSAVMGCYNPRTSDIDLILVVDDALSDRTKTDFLSMVMKLNPYAPKKGIELSIVKKEYCDPFVYPTPFELHFSIAHMAWYANAPQDYIAKMKGTDSDLAAHFTILYHRGKCLYGKEIKDVFGEVPKENYFDSIRKDIAGSLDEIASDPVYFILNLCRVLAYKKEGLILSKAEGGTWGAKHLPEKYHALITNALAAYGTDDTSQPMHMNESSLKDFADYMMTEIG